MALEMGNTAIFSISPDLMRISVSPLRRISSFFTKKHFPRTSVEFYNQLPPTAWKRLEEKDNDELDVLMRWTCLIFCSGVAHDNDGDAV